MAIEIERKFLVSGDFLPEAVSSTRIVQGYICSQPGRTVRVRIRGEEGFPVSYTHLTLPTTERV